MKSKYRFNALLFALLAALLITTAAGAAPKGGAIVSLSVEQGDFDSAQDVLVGVTISNPTNHTVRVLKWFTPTDGVEESLFAVSRDGEPVAYVGPIYKRPAATGNDYISLKAGESISSAVNLGEFYDLSQSGQYEVFYAVAADNLFDEKGNAFKYRDVLTSEKISVKIEGRAKPVKPTPTPPPTSGVSYSACTVERQDLLYTAHGEATIYSQGAETYLGSHNSGTTRFTTWFGTFSSASHTTVQSHFMKISDAFETKPITYDCSCKKQYYAYVYPTQPYKIYLCSVFWQAPMKGTDSKAGTLIHEMSHFDVVAGTDDFVYGQSGAKSLAISDPGKAIMNADNHEYFAENTPALP